MASLWLQQAADGWSGETQTLGSRLSRFQTVLKALSKALFASCLATPTA